MNPQDRVKKVKEQAPNVVNPDPDPAERKPKQGKEKSVHVRLTKEEHDLIEKAAESHGIGVSSFIRFAVREKLGLIR